MSNFSKKKKVSNKSIDKLDSNEFTLSTINLNQSKNESKKVTIRDLCPEEKQKIGELLKKLAEEKEEKEKYKKLIEEEKKNYENKIDSILKEKETSNNFNNSINLKTESFMENFMPTPQNTDNFQLSNYSQATPVDIKNLRDRFDKVFQTLKKTAQNQEEYFSKFPNSLFDDNNNSRNISSSSSMLREEKPLILDYQPTPIENEPIRNFTPSSRNNFDNLLQTSIININDELKENINLNLFSESKLLFNSSKGSFESSEDLFNTNSPKMNMNIISSKKLQSLKEKLQIDDHFRNKREINQIHHHNKKVSNDTSKRNSKYKEMLNRVREKSQEQAHNFNKNKNTDSFSDSGEEDSPKKMKINNLAGSININNLQISSQISQTYSPSSQLKQENNLKSSLNNPQAAISFSSNLNKRNFDEEDNQLISILNSNTSKVDFVTSFRNKCDLKESSVDAKADFYEDNLFDLIDDIEDFYSKKQELKKSNVENKMKIDYNMEKEINNNMLEIENELEEIVAKEKTNCNTTGIKKNNIKKKSKINFLEEIQKLNYKY